LTVTSRLRRLRQTCGLVVALLSVVILVGVTYQGVATALERRRVDRPGGLVDAGGHQLHIVCAGQGTPVVVLEAAAGAMSSAWGWVQPEIAARTRVCAYDRSGLGWSEAGDAGYDPSRVPEQLHTLLQNAGEPGPVLLVGHELGAVFARMYARRYPETVAALVLVDEAASEAPPPPLVSAWPWLARAGALRASRRLTALADGLPGESGEAMRAFLNRPDHLTRAAQELSRRRDVEDAARGVDLDAAITITSISVGVGIQPAMFVEREGAAKVTRAIDETLARVRSAGVHSPSSP
jgi:pimeloyl-ACP methyl ester carboxylesterase